MWLQVKSIIIYIYFMHSQSNLGEKYKKLMKLTFTDKAFHFNDFLVFYNLFTEF